MPDLLVTLLAIIIGQLFVVAALLGAILGKIR